MTDALPTIDDVARAAARLDGVAHRTPVLTSATLNDEVGAELFLKAENFQRAGAFKFRGAYNAVAATDPAERARGVATYSSGNHAQAVALAAALHDVPSVILMPEDAPASKIEATRGYGAEVVFYDRYTEERSTIGDALAADRGMTLVPPFTAPLVRSLTSGGSAKLIPWSIIALSVAALIVSTWPSANR